METDFSLGKNEQIIKFIVERLSGKLGRTHLIKLIYLTDYHSHKLFAKSISTFKYSWNNNGPFDKSFYISIKVLVDKYINEEEVRLPSCKGYVYHDTHNRVNFDKISNKESYLLEYVISNYGTTKLQVLLDDVVYKTEPMEKLIDEGGHGKTVPLEIVDCKDVDLYGGLNPEEIINGETAIQEGKVRPLEEVFGAL